MADKEATKVIITTCTDCSEDITCTDDILVYQCGCKSGVSEDKVETIKVEENTDTSTAEVNKFDVDFDDSSHRTKMSDSDYGTRKSGMRSFARYTIKGYFKEERIEEYFNRVNGGDGDQTLFGYQFEGKSGKDDNFFELAQQKICCPMRLEFNDEKDLIVVGFRYTVYGGKLAPILLPSFEGKKLELSHRKLNTVIEKTCGGMKNLVRVSNYFDDSEKEKIEASLINYFKIKLSNPELGESYILHKLKEGS